MKMSKAEWHDKFFSGIYTKMLAGQYDEATNVRQAKGIKRLLGLRRGQSVLDIPCGQGRLTIPMARLGLEASGLDRQASYIRMAKSAEKRKKAKVNFIAGDMRNNPFTESFDGLFNWFGSFGYFSDRENQKVMEGFYRALKPGGRLLLEGINKDFILKNFKPRMEVNAGGVRTLHENRWSPRDQRIYSRWNFILGRKKEVHDIRLRLFNARDLKPMLQRAGFVQVGFFGDLKGNRLEASSPRMIAVARKGL